MTGSGSPPSPGVLPFAVMCVGMFVALLDIQIVASSLQEIGGGLSAAQDEIGWVQTAYLIAEIVVIPLSGWLTRVFSTRWLFAASAAGFTLASLFCGIAWSIESMIIFRALQGLLGASMIPTVFTSSFYYFEGRRRVYAAAVVAILVRIDRPDLSLLKGADYLGMVLMALLLGTSNTCSRKGRAGAGSTIGRLPPVPGSRGSPGQPQLRARLFPLLHHRHRDILDNLSDAAVSRLCARLQRLANRRRDLFDRGRLARRRAGLCHPRPPYRHALADDVRAGELCRGDVVLQLHHP
jgi:hypothetical protein